MNVFIAIKNIMILHRLEQDGKNNESNEILKATTS